MFYGFPGPPGGPPEASWGAPESPPERPDVPGPSRRHVRECHDRLGGSDIADPVKSRCAPQRTGAAPRVEAPPEVIVRTCLKGFLLAIKLVLVARPPRFREVLHVHFALGGFPGNRILGSLKSGGGAPAPPPPKPDVHLGLAGPAEARGCIFMPGDAR